VLQQGPTPPPRDSAQRPGTPIVLARGEPVAITLHNTRATPVAVHWHGMELESRYDGVGGWSGTGRSVTPAVAPGDTFVARFTPPRAGTFIYHTHDEAGPDLAGGLYGALVVHAPGAPPDSAREHLVVLGAGTTAVGPGQRPVPFVNADTGTTPLVLAATGANRLRLINIADSDLKLVRLVDATGTPLRWRIVGKDGWTPPRHQRTRRAASLLVGVGETYDVELTSADATRAAALLVETRYYPGSPRVRVHEARVPVRVRPVAQSGS
jgi:FtsP/CotA-like multicopper oxidase with cupredoxin domain